MVGSWDKTTPTAFAVIALEWTQSVEAFPTLFCEDVTLPKAVDWLPVPSHVEIADTLANAVTFLPVALRYGTRTFFSSSRY